MPLPSHKTPRVIIDYTNHRGERSNRLIDPIRLWFGSSMYHEGEPKQWFLRARDMAKDAERDFAMKDIHRWSAA